MAKKARKPTKSARRPSRPARSARKRLVSARKRPSAAGGRPAARPSGKRPSKAKARTRERATPTPPSSLNMNRRSSAARTGRAGLRHNLDEHGKISPAITGGDVDADWENAYFSGDEAPGGDNPTPDQEVVDDIGRALGVEYQDNEELRAADKVTARDKHRWELDPASAEDYKERK